mmetsp:Transcript_27058/g.36160  ORF Transcript_27058/g.36160 Transcript_27058/m.36160 type:complete len:218 (-) Transcript_27058:290-943(-)
MMIAALLPPSSRMVLPKRRWTSALTLRPTAVLPVKETRGTRGSCTMAFPMVGPSPVTTVMTLWKPLAFSTSVMTLPRAMVTMETVSAPFQMTWSPQMSARAVFQPQTATGKLKAVMTPTLPTGFQISIIKWPGRSEFRTLPSIVLDIPTAISQISMNSCTSPRPSERTLPISRVTRAPRASFFALRASPICLTISPRTGPGVVCHLAFSSAMAWMHS